MMPTYRVTDPDTGKTLRLTGDSPPTESELEEIFAQIPQSPGEIARAEGGVLNPPETVDEKERFLSSLDPAVRQHIESVSPLDALMIGMGRGFTTFGRGVGIADPETEGAKQSIEQLKEVRPITTTTGEILGESAPFVAPGAKLAGVKSAAGRVLGTAALGGAEAGIITRGQGGDESQQLKATGIGAAFAGGLELALPVLGRLGNKAVRRVLKKAPDGAVIDAAGNPSDELLKALDESGQTFDDIIDEAKDELSKKAVSPSEAARKAFLESQGLDPTRAQVTRNAADFQAQQEAAKTSSMVRDALERQEAILTTRFDNAILNTGGSATSPTSSVVDALTEKATKLDQEIGDLYSAARNVLPGEKSVRFTRLTRTLRELAPSDRRTGGNISAMVGDMKAKGILDDKMNVVGRVDVETSEDLRKLANELYDPANPFGNMQLRKIKDSLDEDVFKAAGDDFFKQARRAKADFEKELTRAKISKFDSRKANLVRDVLENKIDPDQMVDKVVFSKTWRPDDLQQLKSYISTDDAGKAAFDDMRAEVLQKIKDRAFIGPVDESGFQALSRDKLQKALTSVGDKKLSILFSHEENKFLKDMLQVTRLREPVRGTALGRGPTAQAVGRLENALRTNPILRAIMETVSLDSQGRTVLKAKPTPVRQALTGSEVRTGLILPATAAITAEE